MKIFRFACVLIACSLLIPSPIFALDPPEATGQKDQGGDEITKEIEQSIARLSKLFKEGKTDELLKAMTQSGRVDYASDALLMAVELDNDKEFADEMGIDAKRLKKTLSTFGFKKAKLPIAYVQAIEKYQWPSAKEILRARQAAFKMADRSKLVPLLSQLVLRFPDSIFSENRFNGEVGKISVQKEQSLAFVEFQPTVGGEANEVEDGDDGPVMMLPPVMLRFSQENGQWKLDGEDLAKTEQLLEQLMESEQGSMGGFEPLPLIENIQLKGSTVEQKELDLQNLKGKVVLIDFWGTWCGPCVAEIPVMKKIYEAFRDRGFEIIGVASDDQETLQQFFKKTPLPWENIVDAEGNIADEFGVQFFPTTLLVNKEGKHVQSNLLGEDLFDALAEQVNLTAEESEKLKKEIFDESELGEVGEKSGNTDLPIGFEAADEDNDSVVTATELKIYLDDRLQDSEFKHRQVFEKLDTDSNKEISEEEFENRHSVIIDVMGEGYFSMQGIPDPEDPGLGYVFVTGVAQPINDLKIFGATFHRYNDLLESSSKLNSDIDWDALPAKLAESDKQRCVFGAAAYSGPSKTNVQSLVDATLVIAGGGDLFFQAGAVLISKDGLAVTNYHVASALEEGPMLALASTGKSYPVVEVVAGNKERDVAIIRLKGDDLPFVQIATTIPAMGEDIVMMHHSESRYYTYDRGYVMRYPVLGDHPWLEISADYAPGGSGCGIFNRQNELVGLVSMIEYGDGPTLAEGFPSDMEDGWQDLDSEFDLEEGESEDEGWDDRDDSMDQPTLLVKHAVPLQAILEILGAQTKSLKIAQ